MSVGIVATVLLPVIAMLAGGVSNEISSGDREAASRIVSEITRSIQRTRNGEFEIFLNESSSPVTVSAPSTGATTQEVFLVDIDGRWIRQMTLSEYDFGVTQNSSGFYVAFLEFAESEQSHSEETGLPSPLSLQITIESPAAATRDNRDRHLFQTLISQP